MVTTVVRGMYFTDEKSTLKEVKEPAWGHLLLHGWARIWSQAIISHIRLLTMTLYSAFPALALPDLLTFPWKPYCSNPRPTNPSRYVMERWDACFVLFFYPSGKTKTARLYSPGPQLLSRQLSTLTPGILLQAPLVTRFRKQIFVFNRFSGRKCIHPSK